MLTEITLRGFKSFLDSQLPLNTLTVLTGLNSSGKSSIIQALLILEKAASNNNNLLLKGHGSILDLKNRYVDGPVILEVLDEQDQCLAVHLPTNNDGVPNSTIKKESILFPEIIYVSANRFGPKTSVPIFSDIYKKSKIGKRGENLFQCIEFFSNNVLDPSLVHERSEGETLLFNIRGWLSVISPNSDFKFEILKFSDSSYSTFDGHRAMNVGFGLSYALPVIAALLIGTLIKNSLVIIENPEAHLHPKGQTEIAKLIALCANLGTQIIIETHSDHIFDSIRIAAKEYEGFFEKIQLYWFELNRNKNTEVYSPTLDSNGRVNEWPQGFFDQFEINASKLL